MSEQALFRLTKGGHSRKEDGRFRRYKAGEEILLNATEARALRGRVEPLQAAHELEDDAERDIALTDIESPKKIQPPARRRGRPRKEG